MRVGLVANGDPFSAATVQIRCTVANFAQGNTFLGDRGNGTISVSPRFTIRDVRESEVGTVVQGEIYGPERAARQTLARLGTRHNAVFSGIDPASGNFVENLAVYIVDDNGVFTVPTAAQRQHAIYRDDDNLDTTPNLTNGTGLPVDPPVDIDNVRMAHYLDLNLNGQYDDARSPDAGLIVIDGTTFLNPDLPEMGSEVNVSADSPPLFWFDAPMPQELLGRHDTNEPFS